MCVCVVVWEELMCFTIITTTNLRRLKRQTDRSAEDGRLQILYKLSHVGMQQPADDKSWLSTPTATQADIWCHFPSHFHTPPTESCSSVRHRGTQCSCNCGHLAARKVSVSIPDQVQQTTMWHSTRFPLCQFHFIFGNVFVLFFYGTYIHKYRYTYIKRCTY